MKFILILFWSDPTDFSKPATGCNVVDIFTDLRKAIDGYAHLCEVERSGKYMPSDAEISYFTTNESVHYARIIRQQLIETPDRSFISLASLIAISEG